MIIGRFHPIILFNIFSCELTSISLNPILMACIFPPEDSRELDFLSHAAFELHRAEQLNYSKNSPSEWQRLQKPLGRGSVVWSGLQPASLTVRSASHTHTYTGCMCKRGRLKSGNPQVLSVIKSKPSSVWSGLDLPSHLPRSSLPKVTFQHSSGSQRSSISASTTEENYYKR